MKVTLINANTIKPPLSPIGLLYLSAYLKSKGMLVNVVDLCCANDIPAALSSMGKNQPDIIGVSIRNIDAAQMKMSKYFLPDVLTIIKLVKEQCPRTPLVLGGAGFSIAPVEIMEMTKADYGVVGEGEAALYALVQGLQTGSDVRAVAGLIFRDGDGKIRINPPQNSSTAFLRALPFQDLDAVNYSLYYNQGGMASLQTKRGCALDCVYCTYPLIEGKNYRLIPPAHVVDEMEYVLSRGYDYFHFSDSVFNVPREHALQVCREIIRRGLKVKWHAYMSPQGFDAELAGVLAAAGNDGVLFGVDSCSESMLGHLGKGFHKRDIAHACEACRVHGLEFSFHILFGAPGETMETVEETLQAIDDLRPTAAFLTQGIRVYRDTPIYKRLVSEGKLDPGRSLLEPYFYLSEELGPRFPGRVHEYAVARDFVFSDTTAKSPSTDEAVVALYKRNFRGPCWKILKELKRVSAGR
ncbi:MAG: hypothetical protein A2X34_05900 [Elusimicrobia bacterium GWC2_51_8]|nr:MAG: hypothetical protein A2X33_07080 [Elusimicrobia bacterium GWA2_51_34]OGR64965.1 MAG: hypothetical protein A2X34_05900 [Elusimicrobia bacterium GWC2_51_8]HAF95336.1 hypothetical protein [Elusimicrobiota bacterium]HCE96891.1 hypothetical protein [Elusimicrobiota bacterium]